MTFTLPKLPYAYDALQPYMSKQTLELHHDKHHKTYVDTANKLIQGSGLEGKSLEEVVRASHAQDDKNALFNNAAQHWNHSEFWLGMKPNGGGTIPGEVDSGLKQAFGGFDGFKEKFVAEGTAQFGSGWVWLVLDEGKFAITRTPNAHTPMAHGKQVLLACDVWEHGYYLDYQNRRADFLTAFLDHLVNWDHVAERLHAADARKAA